MAEAVKDYQKLEHDIIRLAGGADNIASAQRCATRLRLVLKNTPGQAEGKNNIFMVGDVKQSIYSFRLSRLNCLCKNITHTV